MLYIFMDNFRGFSETVIPLRKTTFLTGENSTGKSSFLSLLFLFSNPQFWFSADFSPSDCCDLGGFKDIVSAGSSMKNFFSIGLIATHRKNKKGDQSLRECAFSLMAFRDDDGLPKVSKYIQFMDGKLSKIVFLQKTWSYKTSSEEPYCSDDSELIEFFQRVYREDKNDQGGFKAFPTKMRLQYPPPLPFMVAMLESLERNRKEGEISLSHGFPPVLSNLSWLAPIRTKPRRTYDGFMANFTPEGAHTPHVIRKTLSSKSKARRFLRLLKRFGKSSGLFTSIKAHSFGEGHDAPFEVLIELAGEPLNISNVGYGVSQVLPVVVEMLTRPKNHWFAIQQPEVHLHPRAQAALGSLMHFLSKEMNYHFIVETHSDYLVDRFRLSVKEMGDPQDSQVVFFERTPKGNVAYPMLINERGQYPADQPKSFRDFFIREELHLLEI